MSGINDKLIISSDGYIHFVAGDIAATITGGKIQGVSSILPGFAVDNPKNVGNYAAIEQRNWISLDGKKLDIKEMTDFTPKEIIDHISNNTIVSSGVNQGFAIHLFRPEGEYIFDGGKFIHPNGVTEDIGTSNYWEVINRTVSAQTSAAAGSYGVPSAKPPVKNLPYGKKEVKSYDDKKTPLENVSDIFKDNPLIFLVPIAGLLVLSFVIKD